MNSYLHIKSFLGQEKTIEPFGGWSPFSCKDKFKNIKNWLKNQSLLFIDQKKELEMTPALETEGPSGIYQLQTSSRSVHRQAQRTSEEAERSQEPSRQGPNKANWHRPYPQGYRIPKLEPSAVDSVFNMARTLMEFTLKEQERMNRTFP
ncbi:hypothetical protein O181_051823 [Austropuccinia psidii MF-1]|uniref:Uncharacterized protein n=1 Tax=Austropuccinia psidii MF-1 TaxID=1389203 RepID=A0A9Q3HNR5_9BASI|nr:hypothetical protein [Austropuccinia psidii MF-1]